MQLENNTQLLRAIGLIPLFRGPEQTHLLKSECQVYESSAREQTQICGFLRPHIGDTIRR